MCLLVEIYDDVLNMHGPYSRCNSEFDFPNILVSAVIKYSEPIFVKNMREYFFSTS
jgi:hypothetical protein